MANTTTKWRLLAGLAGAAILHASPAIAQARGSGDSASQNTGGDIIVTAQRVEQRLQDVPISITVMNQDALSRRNIVSTADLGSFVPSLSTNAQFGAEKTSFVIRGFTQEGKTSPSVGVYFADVVAPRSFGGTTGGNGAGVGSVFDLQNIQVLKGPQGTLFGRNTTGGAILLVPQKPTGKLEGYVQGSIGDYNLRRLQAVINIPLSDTFKVRLGVDRNKRDGYLINKSGVGPNAFDNTNYLAARLSIVADLTPDLENYIIASYSRSRTNGDLVKVMACAQPPYSPFVPLAPVFAPFGCGQIARAAARGDGYWTADNSDADPFERVSQWQVINTTTWQASDSLRVKNIISYAEYREQASFSLFGDNLLFPAGSGPLTGQRFSRTIELHPGYSGYNSQQSTFTEELQLQGQTSDARLNWQVGAYVEVSKPLGFNSGLTGIFLNCTDTQALNCTNPLGFGTISDSQVKDSFNNKGFYAQGTYKLTDQLNLTGGIRYTIDKMSDLSENLNIAVPTPGTGLLFCQNLVQFHGATPTSPLFVTSPSQCDVRINKEWKKPTWLVQLDYKPSADMMLYAKWARGYRQGSINSNNVGFETVGPETVDTYEVGAKTSFRGAVSGYFNFAGFYNNFRNQELAVNPVIAAAYNGLIPQSQPIVNAGKSRIWGVEVDASITPFTGFTLDAAYAYLNTKLLSFTPPPLPIYYVAVFPSADVGQSLALSPKNRVTLTGTYTLPLDDSIGRISFGATFTHTDSNRAVSPSVSPNFYQLQPSNLVNLNASWNSVLGKPFDLSFFMTNATNEKRIAYPATSMQVVGFEGGHLNQPRMFGFSLKVHFAS